MAGLLDALGAGPQQPTPQQPGGLSAAVNPVPDMAAPPPATPEEAAQRKQGWRQVLDTINNDPSIQQAMMVMGLQMMTPNANFGQAGLAGVAAYNDAQQQQRKQQQEEVQNARVAKKDEQQLAMGAMELQKAQADAEWMAQRRPLELQKLEAEIAKIPGDAERAQLELDLKKMQLEQEPELAKLRLAEIRARIAAAGRQGTAALRETDQQRAIQALMHLPEYADLPPAEKLARATQDFYQTSRGVPTRMKLDAADQEAVNLYEMYVRDPESLSARMAEIDPEVMAKIRRGEQLYQQHIGQTGIRGPVTSAPQGAKPAPVRNEPAPPQPAPRRVISAEEIRKQQSVDQRTSTGLVK